MSYRDFIYNKFSIDPMYFLTIASMSYELMLLKTGVRLEMISDSTILSILASNVRAGLTFSTAHEESANNEFMVNYDPHKENKTILCLDVVALYSSVLCEFPCATGCYKLLTGETDLKILKQKIICNRLTKRDQIGFYICCDIEYPEHLHDIHNQFPLLTERKKFKNDNVYKLVSSLENKNFYCSSALLIQSVVTHGLKITRIHYAVSYNQSFFLSEYVKGVMALRAEAKSKFMQNFLKILCNVIFG